MLASLLLTNPPSNKTKKEKEIPKGTQPERNQGNGLHLKLTKSSANTIQEKACKTEVTEELKKSQ